MAKKNPKTFEIPTQDPNIRIKNFEEVALGYTKEQALEESKRCYQCKKAKCVEGCPVNVNIPDFIKAIQEEHFEEAYEILSDSLLFPRITGRVCPQENQCEGNCIAGKREGYDSVSVGALERFIGDWAAENNIETNYRIKNNGMSVGIIGSGPAGITAAADLRKKGYYVTVYEALHVLGGVLVYGIPEFRLPKAIVRNEIRKIEKMGVEIKYNTLVGATIPFEKLKEKHDAIFIGTGAGLPRFLGIPGEELIGVYAANEFLVRVNLMGGNKFPQYDTPIEIGKRVAVIGGGNVAMDCTRVARRLGAEVDLYYRRTRAYMPARLAEIHHALEEGINFKELQNPIELVGDEYGRLKSVRYAVNELSEDLDSSGRNIPVETGEIKVDDYDTFIIAVGQNPNPLLPKRTPCVKCGKKGYIIVDPDTLRVLTNDNYPIFAGGDIIGNQHNGEGGTVILAMGHGRLAAKGIDEILSQKQWNTKPTPSTGKTIS